MKKNKILLSISGGGLYGCGVANFLPKLKQCPLPDYVAGTSVGSIIAGLIAIGYSYENIANLFNGNLPKKIFTKPGFPMNLNPLRSSTYDNKEVKKVLKDIFQDLTIKDTKIPIIIVAWNYEKQKAKVFTKTYNSDVLLRDAILASISAPSYFPIVELNKEQLGDGGVCGNNPSLAGISAMRDDGIMLKNIRCLSLETGGEPKSKKLKIHTLINWLPVITDVITLGNVSYTSYCVQHILDERFLNISPKTLPHGKMDDFGLVKDIVKEWSKVNHSEAIDFLNGNPPKLLPKFLKNLEKPKKADDIIDIDSHIRGKL